MPPLIRENKEEWWELVDENWGQLIGIMWAYLPLHTPQKIYEGEERFSLYSNDTMREVVEKAKNDRDPILARYLSACWEAAPDDRSIHSIPGWDVLCNLLSEEYVLDEEEEKERR